MSKLSPLPLASPERHSLFAAALGPIRLTIEPAMSRFEQDPRWNVFITWEAVQLEVARVIMRGLFPSSDAHARRVREVKGYFDTYGVWALDLAIQIFDLVSTRRSPARGSDGRYRARDAPRTPARPRGSWSRANVSDELVRRGHLLQFDSDYASLDGAASDIARRCIVYPTRLLPIAHDLLERTEAITRIRSCDSRDDWMAVNLSSELACRLLDLRDHVPRAS